MTHEKGMEQVGGMKGWRKFTKEQIIKALVKTGTKSGAAQALKCDRATITRAIDEDPEIAKAVEEAKEILIDLAETALMKNVQDGHHPAVAFVLKTLGKERGYVERIENTGKGGGPIESEIKVRSNNQKLLDTIDKLSRQVTEEDTKANKKQTKSSGKKKK